MMTREQNAAIQAGIDDASERFGAVREALNALSETLTSLGMDILRVGPLDEDTQASIRHAHTLADGIFNDAGLRRALAVLGKPL